MNKLKRAARREAENACVSRVGTNHGENSVSYTRAVLKFNLRRLGSDDGAILAFLGDSEPVEPPQST